MVFAKIVSHDILVSDLLCHAFNTTKLRIEIGIELPIKYKENFDVSSESSSLGSYTVPRWEVSSSFLLETLRF